MGGERDRQRTAITEGGLDQVWTRKRKAEREVKGGGVGRTLRWNRKALLNYTQCKTSKEKLGVWRHTLDPWGGPLCRECGFELETSKYVALVCNARE